MSFGFELYGSGGEVIIGENQYGLLVQEDYMDIGHSQSVTPVQELSKAFFEFVAVATVSQLSSSGSLFSGMFTSYSENGNTFTAIYMAASAPPVGSSPCDLYVFGVKE